MLLDRARREPQWHIRHVCGPAAVKRFNGRALDPPSLGPRSAMSVLGCMGEVITAWRCWLKITRSRAYGPDPSLHPTARCWRYQKRSRRARFSILPEPLLGNSVSNELNSTGRPVVGQTTPAMGNQFIDAESSAFCATRRWPSFSMRREGEPSVVAAAKRGVRSALFVPMLRNDDVIGALGIWRERVESHRKLSQPDLEDAKVYDAIAGLIAKSLASTDLSGPLPRYRLLDATRTYAAAKLRDTGEDELLRRRHALCYRVNRLTANGRPFRSLTLVVL
jgi:hypothetical protein